MPYSSGRIRSPFLQQCVQHLAASAGKDLAEWEGGEDTSYFHGDSGDREYVHFPFFPTLPDGIPSFNPATSTWEFFGPGGEALNLAILIDSNRRVCLAAGDDDTQYLDVTVEGPEEIGEILASIRLINERNATLVLKQARFPTPAGHPNVRRTEGTATSLLHKAVGFSST